MTTVEVNPPKIRKKIQKGETEEASLTIHNVSGETQDYRVQAEKNYSPWVDPKPDFFPLHADATRAVLLRIAPAPDAKLGTHGFDLLVFNDNDEADQVAIPVEVHVPIPVLWWILGAILLSVVLMLLLWLAGVFG